MTRGSTARPGATDPEGGERVGPGAPGGPVGLTEATRSLIAVSAALAAGGEDDLRRALEVARERAPGLAVEEAILQSYLFLGYPAALNGFALWRSVAGGPADGVDEAGGAGEELDRWTRRGEEVCRTVYGDQYEALRANVRELHPEMERWMVTEGYGKVLGRPGLALRVRELCVVGVLAVLDAPVQLYSHLRGALNAGAAPGEVEEAIGVAAGFGDDEARRVAAATWARVRDRTG